MKPLKTFGFAAAAALSIFTGSLAHAAILPGTVAPDFTLKNSNGEDVTLSSFKGSPVVLEWSNYECPFVVMHYGTGNIPNLQKSSTEQGVVWLTIHTSAEGEQGYYTPEQMKVENVKVNNQATHTLHDASGAVGKLYEAKTTPHMFVINAEGVVEYNGAIDSIPSAKAETLATAVPLTANAIDAVLKGEKPAVPASQPYGCGVKYAK